MARAKKQLLVSKDKFRDMVLGPKGKLAVSKALVHLFNRQTAHEQLAETTEEHNGIGFTGIDGEYGVSCAKYVIRWGMVSDKQYEAWIKPSGKNGYPRICKYWKQINEEAEKAKLAAAQQASATLPLAA